MTIREMLQRRAQAIAAARAINDRAGADGSLSAEDQTAYDRAIAEAKNWAQRVKDTETLEAEERVLDGRRAPVRGQRASRTREECEEQGGTWDSENETCELPEENARRGQRTSRPRTLTPWARCLLGDPAARTQFRTAEFRADTLQADASILGGYMIGPEEWIDQLLQNVDDLVWIRQEVGSEIIRIERSDTLGQAVLDTDLDDFDWTTELGTGNQGDIKVGKRESRAHPMAKRVKISNKLLRLTNVEQVVRSRIAYKLGVTQEKAYLTGTGVGRPLGVFVASTDGVPTSRDVSTDNTTTEIRYDNVKRIKYTLKPQYWDGASWLFHTDAVSQLSRLKDGDGRYTWRGTDRPNEPDFLEGFPVRMSQFAPSTFTTGKYVGMLANWKRGYRIVDALDLAVQVLDQLYAEANEIGYIARYEGDGQPVISEAFVRMKLA